MLRACQWPLLDATGRADFAGEGGEVAGCSAWGGRRGSGAGMRGAELRGPPGAARREAVCGGPREGGIPRRGNVRVASKFGKDSVSHDVEMRGRVGSPAFLSVSRPAPPHPCRRRARPPRVALPCVAFRALVRKSERRIGESTTFLVTPTV